MFELEEQEDEWCGSEYLARPLRTLAEFMAQRAEAKKRVDLAVRLFPVSSPSHPQSEQAEKTEGGTDEVKPAHSKNAA